MNLMFVLFLPLQRFNNSQLLTYFINHLSMRKARELSVSVGDLNMENEFMSPAMVRGNSNNPYMAK